MRPLLTLLVVLGGCSSSTSSPANAVRGEYLVQAVLSCGDCHTTPTADGLPSFDPADFLAGGRAFIVPFGAGTQKFFAKNLTSDKATGIGSWSEAQIKRAISTGIDNHGNALFPVMPYFVFGNLSDDDLTSIALFLRTLPAKSNLVPDDTLSLPSPAKVVDASMIPHTSLPSSDPNYASAERGRYMAGLTGACIECHTPQTTDLDNLLDFARAFAGGQSFDIGTTTVRSANLTPDITGLAGWSAADLIASIQEDKEKGTGRALCPPMPGGPNRDGDMTPGDLTDIANYLTTLQPISYGRFGCDDAGTPIGLDIN